LKIATVTLNPALDQTVRADHFQAGAVNRGSSLQLDPGGKGVNVASCLADYGLEVAVTGFLGAENPALFEQLFARKGIEDHFIRIPGRTRTNLKIVDEALQQTTDINLRGQTPPPAAVAALLARLEQLAETCRWFALSGNLPPGLPDTIYAELISRIKSRGGRVALDTSQGALAAGLPAGPTLLKPNQLELEQLAGHALPDEPAVLQAARGLLASGCELVAVSQGARGALLVTQEQALRAVPPAVPVKSSVGAGDAMLAGLIAAQVAGLSLADSARLATAFSLGAITRLGAHLPELDELQAYAAQVQVTPLA
jgi:1-phosphofructokinase